MSARPMPHDRVGAAIRAARDGGRTALVAFLTGGFPDRRRFRESLATIADVADLVEIGVPFTDPMADGVTIQRASNTALAAGFTLASLLDDLAAIRPRPRAPLLLMSYLNPLLAYGFERLPEAAAAAGVSGFIVPDLPHEESPELRLPLDRAGLALVQMVTPVTPPARLQMLCADARGFVYAVTMTGTTGRSVAVPDEVLGYLDRVRAASSIPVCAGFGIRARAQVERLAGHVDGVIVGSALVEVIERGGDPVAFLRELRGA